MSRKVLGITTFGQIDSEQRIRYSPTGDPGTMAVVQNTASRQDRCLIDPFDSNHLVTVGSGSCYYSMNEGVTWNTSSLPDSTNVRNLLSPESGVLYAVTNCRSD